MNDRVVNIRIGDLVELVTKGTTPSRGKGFSERGVNYIKSECIGYDGTIDTSKFVFIDEETHSKLLRSQLREGDILFSMAGAFLGKNAVVKNNMIPANTNQALAIIRVKRELADPYFVAYSLRTKYMIRYINSMSAQSAQPNINFQEIRSLQIRLPELQEQKAIAHILGTLDHKIELNRKMNETLEAMAQALFKSWFVDFDPVLDKVLAASNPIPEALQAKADKRKAVHKNGQYKPLPKDIQDLFPAAFEYNDELGKWIPEGWEGTNLNNNLDTISKTYDFKEVSKVVFLNTGDICNGSFLHSNYSITETLPGQAKKSIETGDILYSEIRPKNKRFAFVNFDAKNYVVSTKLMVLRPKSNVDPLFFYQILKSEKTISILQHLAETRSGTFPQITFTTLEKIKYCFPNNDSLVNKYCSYLRLIYQKNVSLNTNTDDLIKARDLLLSQLISGKTRLPKSFTKTFETKAAAAS